MPIHALYRWYARTRSLRAAWLERDPEAAELRARLRAALAGRGLSVVAARRGVESQVVVVSDPVAAANALRAAGWRLEPLSTMLEIKEGRATKRSRVETQDPMHAQ